MKEESRKKKLTLQLLLGVILTLSGIILIWVSLFIPPVGIIHASVLTAFGEMATFAGALIGIDYSYKYKLINKQFKMTSS